MFAALNLLDGTVIGSCKPQHRHEEFIAFMEQIDSSTPKRRALHLILDNYGTHKHPAVRDWFIDHPRFHLHFIPTSSSWLNLVERWFAELTCKHIRRGTFRNVPRLIKAIKSFLSESNKNPRRFVWTATPAKIMKKIKHCKEALETGHQRASRFTFKRPTSQEFSLRHYLEPKSLDPPRRF